MTKNCDRCKHNEEDERIVHIYNHSKTQSVA